MNDLNKEKSLRNGILILSRALYWRMKYEDSNPEVGMGSNPDILLNDILYGMGDNIVPYSIRQQVIELAKTGECYE